MSRYHLTPAATAFLWALRCKFIVSNCRPTAKAMRHLPPWVWRLLNKWKCRRDPEHKAALVALLQKGLMAEQLRREGRFRELVNGGVPLADDYR